QPPDGPAGAGGFHRARYVPVDHAGAVRGAFGFQVPAVPAAGEVCRGRVAGTEDQPRVLRLHGHAAATDAVGITRRFGYQFDYTDCRSELLRRISASLLGIVAVPLVGCTEPVKLRNAATGEIATCGPYKN